MRKWGNLLLAIMIMALFFITGCSNKVKSGSSEVKRPMISGVTLVEVKKTTVDEYNETAGTIKAKNTSVIASKVMGTITNILVKEGDRVSSGQILLTLDDRDVVTKVAAAQAGYQEKVKALEMARENQVLASATNERYRQLYEQSAISHQQMDQVATQGKVAELDFQRNQQAVKQAQASLAEAKAYYDFSQIIAPTNGIITAKKIDIGSMSVPGTTLLVLEDDSSYTLEADVDESIAGNIRIGMAASAQIDSLGQAIQGIITEIAPAVDSTTRKVHIKMDVKGEGLKSGLYAHVKIPIRPKETMLVNKKAIVEKGQLTGVYVVDQTGLAVYRIVRIGKGYDDQVEILSGIQAGEKIIVNGLEKVIDGGVVKEVTG